MTGQEGVDRIRARVEAQLRDNPPPVLLTKADALAFAATYLEANAGQLRLVSLLLGMAKGSDAGEAELLAKIKRHAIEPDLQIAAMNAAASAIHEIALEERILAARVARDGGRSR